MRDWLNAIFTFIGTSSLTDPEYASINFLNLEVNNYNQAAYDELSKVLEGRENVSTMQARLVGVFHAKGLTGLAVASTGSSEIYLGSVLE
jgi:hypothetical protein